MNSFEKITVACVFGFVITGCSSSSEPTMADMMRNHAGSMQSQVELQHQLAKDWETGTNMVASAKKQSLDAEKRMKQAEAELADAKNDAAEATQQRTEGQRLIDESQLKFQQAFPSLPLPVAQSPSGS